MDHRPCLFDVNVVVVVSFEQVVLPLIGRYVVCSRYVAVVVGLRDVFAFEHQVFRSHPIGIHLVHPLKAAGNGILDLNTATFVLVGL